MPKNKAKYTTEIDARDLRAHLIYVADILDATHRLSKVVDDMATALGDMDLLTDINNARNGIVFAAGRLRGCADAIREKQAAA